MKKNIIICLLFLIGFWIVFLAFQNETIYCNSLGIIGKTYYHSENGTIERARNPYEKITDGNTIHWDAAYYHLIKEEGYSANDNYRFAFFPLFPYIWRLSGISSSNVIFLNFFMFMGGLLLLAHLFKQKWKNVLLILALPMTVIFLIPYTEATFFLMFSIAVYGYVKDKYWIYFIAMTLASLSRNTIFFVFPAILCAETLFFIRERNVRQSLFRLIMGSLPVLTGTALLSLIQYEAGGGSIFKFIEAQTYWKNKFSLPDLTNLRDWSTESFAVNVPTLIMIGIPLIAYITSIALKQLNVLTKHITFFSFSSENKSDYLNVILLFCCLSAFCSVLLFRGGSLHGLSRFVICSPYFVILMFLHQEKFLSINIAKRVIYFSSLAILSLFLILLFKKFSLGFYYFGYFIFVGTMALYLFKDKKQKLAYKIFLIVTPVISIVWTTYLFNMYLCNAWLYT